MRELNTGAALPCRPSRSQFFVRTGRIVVAGSAPWQRAQLRMALEFEGHRVLEAETADQILQESSSGLNHVLILSPGFDGMDQYELCRAIRRNSDLGIIVVPGDDSRQGRIDALNAGADDYLSSPFVLQELLARVRAVLRRVTQSRSDDQGNQVILQDRAIDFQSRKIKGPGSRVSHLTPKEFLVLQCLVSHANTAFTNQNLSQSVWQRDGVGDVEYVRVVIRQLRRKLEPDPDNPRYLLTERSVGYRFLLPPAAGQSAATERSRLSLAS
jgi:two-component system, OmpR family, KDP operon response regulator KdpE